MFCCFLTLVSPREVQTLEAVVMVLCTELPGYFLRPPLPLLLDPVAMS